MEMNNINMFTKPSESSIGDGKNKSGMYILCGADDGAVLDFFILRTFPFTSFSGSLISYNFQSILTE